MPLPPAVVKATTTGFRPAAGEVWGSSSGREARRETMVGLKWNVAVYKG